MADASKCCESKSFTLKQALRTRAFYIICFDSMSGCILGAGTFFHLIPSVITENGGSRVDVAVELVMPMGIMEAVMSLTIGRLIDRRVPARFMVGFSNILQFLIILSVPHINSSTRAFAMGFPVGFTRVPMDPAIDTSTQFFWTQTCGANSRHTDHDPDRAQQSGLYYLELATHLQGLLRHVTWPMCSACYFGIA